MMIEEKNISSAGIGRTGVFIALYYLIEDFERRHMLNVKQVVDTIRIYRTNLVQTNVCYNQNLFTIDI